MNNEEDKEDTSDEEDFYAPPVPPPQKSPKIPLDSEELTEDSVKKIEKIDTEIFNPIVIHCERCNKEVVIPIPIKPVLESKKREMLVTYVHKNNKNNDKHCLVFEIDHDFDILLPKAIDVIISTVTSSTNNKKNIEQKSPDIRYVIINCEKCNGNIHVPIPTKIIENSKIPKTPITYIHKEKNNDEPHSVILYLDKDYGDRDTRFADILILFLFPYWLKSKYCFY